MRHIAYRMRLDGVPRVSSWMDDDGARHDEYWNGFGLVFRIVAVVLPGYCHSIPVTIVPWERK